MERRDFLKIALGAVAGAAAIAATAQAAPLTPQPLGMDGRLPANQDAHPAVTSQSEVDRLEPQEVRWGHHWHGHHWGWHRHRHWGWHHHRHWGWHHRWHHRHWGWHRHWHRHHWRRRYW